MKAFNPVWLGLSAPLLTLVLGGLAILLLETFTRDAPAQPSPDRSRSSRAYLAILTLIIFGLTALLEIRVWNSTAEAQLIYHGMLVVDRWSIFLGWLFCAGGILATLLGQSFMREYDFEYGEFYALLLFSSSGMLLMAQAADLVALYLGLEIMSLAVYILTGSRRGAARATEGALKYFLVGAFASALFIYGLALIYGTSGATNLSDIARAIRMGELTSNPVFLIGVYLVLAGLAFKVAAVPFHMWLPDAYEGAPTPVTAFMSAGVKVAGFAALIRVLATGLLSPELTFGIGGWAWLAAALAIITMTLGNLTALRQDNVKRLLAYSAIAHAGYIFVGVAAMGTGHAEARGAILYYLVAYTFATVGAFAVVAWYGNRQSERLSIDDWAGMASRHPAAALAMTVFLLSLGGIPPTAGFFGKFYIFRVALGQPGLVPLVLIAIANSLISLFYYLRIVSIMYFREVGREPHPLQTPSIWAALLLSAAGTLGLGLAPGWLIDLASRATLYLPR